MLTCSDIAGIVLLVSILQPLVDSSFLAVSEVGRLAQVSPDLYQAALHLGLFLSARVAEYTNTLQSPRGIIGFTSNGASAPMVKQRLSSGSPHPLHCEGPSPICTTKLVCLLKDLPKHQMKHCARVALF